MVSRSPFTFSLTKPTAILCSLTERHQRTRGVSSYSAPIMKRCSSFRSERGFTTSAPHLPLPVVNGQLLLPSRIPFGSVSIYRSRNLSFSDVKKPPRMGAGFATGNVFKTSNQKKRGFANAENPESTRSCSSQGVAQACALHASPALQGLPPRLRA